MPAPGLGSWVHHRPIVVILVKQHTVYYIHRSFILSIGNSEILIMIALRSVVVTQLVPLNFLSYLPFDKG